MHTVQQNAVLCKDWIGNMIISSLTALGEPLLQSVLFLSLRRISSPNIVLLLCRLPVGINQYIGRISDTSGQ